MTFGVVVLSTGCRNVRVEAWTGDHDGCAGEDRVDVHVASLDNSTRLGTATTGRSSPDTD